MAFSSRDALLLALEGQNPSDFTLGARRGLLKEPLSDGSLGNMRLRNTLRAYAGQPAGYGSQMPGLAAPIMAAGQGNPAIPMGAGLSQVPRLAMGGLLSAPMSYAPQNVPSPEAAQAGPLPPQRSPAPQVAQQPQPQQHVPYPPQRPEGLGVNPMASIQGFNPHAFAGNAQQYADQFAGGDLSKLGARTYRNEDGTSWNDYYLLNPGAA